MNIQFLGHSSFLVEGTKKILIDPFLTGNPNAAMKAEDISADYILVSHAHGDHFGDALAISKRTGAPIIAVNELALFCQREGCDAHAMHIGGFHSFDENFSVKLTSALHGAANDGIDHGYMGLACGFLIYLDGKTLYFAGDTALTYDMKAVIGDFNEIDVALLPIGDNFTMGPEDAAIAVKWLRPSYVIPMHYNTFPIIEQDAEAFKTKVEKETDAKVKVLASGEFFEL